VNQKIMHTLIDIVYGGDSERFGAVDFQLWRIEATSPSVTPAHSSGRGPSRRKAAKP
jgi:hypothetical protein